MSYEAKFSAEAIERAAREAAEKVAGLLTDETLGLIINDPQLDQLVRSAAADVQKRRRATRNA